MGFPAEHVAAAGEQQQLLSEFVCAICQQLAEPAVYTPCTHVFCGPCLQVKLHCSISPSCTPSHTPRPLARPLAR
jgi:hypothetical protein